MEKLIIFRLSLDVQAFQQMNCNSYKEQAEYCLKQLIGENGVILDKRDFEKELPETRDTTYTQQPYEEYLSNFHVLNWTKPTYDGWSAENSNVSLGITGSANRLRVESTNSNDGVIREFTTIPGREYQVSFYVDKGTLPNVSFKAYDVSSLNVLTQIFAQTMTASQVYTYTFTPTQTKIRLKFHQAGVFLIDDVVITGFALASVDFTDLEAPVYVEPSVDNWAYNPSKSKVYFESNAIFMMPTNSGKITRNVPGAIQTQSFELEGNIELVGTGNKDASLWIFRKPFGSQTWDSTLLATTTIGGSFSFSFSVSALIPSMVVWKTTKNTTLKLTSYTLKKGGASVQIGNFISPVIVKPSYDGWTIDTKTQLLRKKCIGNSNKLIPGVQKTFSTTASTTYRFSADIGYLSSGGGGIGMGASSPNEESLDGNGNPISAFAFNFYDSIIVYKMIGTQQTRITAKRYSGTGPMDITFSAPSSQTKVEFVPGNVVSTTYAYYVDNMRLSTVTGSVIYTSNFTTATIVSQNTDGWASNWASSYMNVSSGSLNQLRVSGRGTSNIFSEKGFDHVVASQIKFVYY